VIFALILIESKMLEKMDHSLALMQGKSLAFFWRALEKQQEHGYQK
jgi:hypothetical protein